MTWHQGHNWTNPSTYWVAIDKQNTPVELISNCWFILTLYHGWFCTKQSSIVALKNTLGLNLYPNPVQTPALSTHNHFGFDPNTSSSELSRESITTQQSFSNAWEVPELHVNTAVASQEAPLEQPTLAPSASLFTQPLKDPLKDLNPDPIIMTMKPPLNGGGGLCGTVPNIFDRNQSRSDVFWNKFQYYWLLSWNNNAISNPFNRVLMALFYIWGPLVEDWVGAQYWKLECCLNLRCTDYVTDTSEVLWTEFERVFNSAWKDREKKQSAYEQLIKLSMKDLDIDSYAKFDWLAAVVGWKLNAERMIEWFMRGLQDNIHWHILSWDTEPTTITASLNNGAMAIDIFWR